MNTKSLDNIIAYEDGTLGGPETIALFQELTDSGMAWRLQGHYGRTAAGLLASGAIEARTSMARGVRDKERERAGIAYGGVN